MLWLLVQASTCANSESNVGIWRLLKTVSPYGSIKRKQCDDSSVSSGRRPTKPGGSTISSKTSPDSVSWTAKGITLPRVKPITYRLDTGEPDARKGPGPVREGAVGKGPHKRDLASRLVCNVVTFVPC